MRSVEFDSDFQRKLLESLAYLNLSSGTPDPHFRRNLSDLVGVLEACPETRPKFWTVLREKLLEALEAHRGSSDALRDTSQAETIVRVAFDECLPYYREFHRDLLFHQSDAALFRPFFLAEVCEAALQELAEGAERIVPAAVVDRLNTYIGHRPVGVLRTPQKIEPYEHEWVCPIPLYFAGSGVAAGRYEKLIGAALEILAGTPDDILDEAHFSLSHLDELAVDPRAYDFDHPVNKRPSYHFGAWDPHRVDNKGFYRRFVLQEVTLEALYQRTIEESDVPQDELLFEAAAVLAGAILMGSGVSGQGPDAHDSNTTLATLAPRIARYRDRFYQDLLNKAEEPRASRLRAEAAALHQPFGAARQHLNQRLAWLRASQLQHVRLAQLFARMGFLEASQRQARIVPVASARMICEGAGRVTVGRLEVERGRLYEAADHATRAIDMLRRGIECGALVDPWNILAFQGQFSLFPAIENSVRDHRVDVLTHMVSQIFDLLVRISSQAAASGDRDLDVAIELQLTELASWWDQFASDTVEGIESVNGRQTAEAAKHIAQALSAWREAGAAAGDVAFWRRHVVLFDSPKAFGVVIRTLLERRDFVAAMALLIQWLSRASEIALVEDEHSFFELVIAWIEHVWADGNQPEEAAGLTRKFFDFLEANADDYWSVPRFELSQNGAAGKRNDRTLGEELDDEDDEDEDGNLFSAAYQGMTYRDSTSGGPDSDMLDWESSTTSHELDHEATRVRRRLAFHAMLARAWRLAATCMAQNDVLDDDLVDAWRITAERNYARLLELLDAIDAHPIPTPSGTRESLLEFERRRSVKEMLVTRAVATAVEVGGAARALRIAGSEPRLEDLQEWERVVLAFLHALHTAGSAKARPLFEGMLRELEKQTLLYAPLGRGGSPREMVAAHSTQNLIIEMLKALPRAAMLVETDKLLATAHAMELWRPSAGDGAISEFDRLFETGYKALVNAIITFGEDWQAASVDQAPADKHPDTALVGCLQMLTEPLLKRWLAHSRGLRISVMERFHDRRQWEEVVAFVQAYGADIFQQHFMNLGSMRAILRQGVNAYLRSLEEMDPPCEWRLLADLDTKIPRARAVDLLTMILEAVVENYAEYKDFNSTTTQSDSGDRLYMLLDILRLKATYDRFAWNIRPLVMAHEVLVRRGKVDAAALWRRTIVERTREVADARLAEFDALSRKYSMRLPTIADRLGERFIRPLFVDQLRALIPAAMSEMRAQGGANESEAAGKQASENEESVFTTLQRRIDELAEHPTGAGLDVPAWIVALEQEVDRVESESRRAGCTNEEAPEHAKLTLKEARQQLKAIAAAHSNGGNGGSKQKNNQ